MYVVVWTSHRPRKDIPLGWLRRKGRHKKYSVKK
jgi:hypothetical protein